MSKKEIPELIVEYKENIENFCFLSVLEYRNNSYLVVIDNVSEDRIGAYVLDYASQEKLNIEQLMSIITKWFYKSSHKYPLSFEFSKLNLTSQVNKIYKNFERVNVTRLIGNNFTYGLNDSPKIKRRRITKMSSGVEITLKKN